MGSFLYETTYTRAPKWLTNSSMLKISTVRFNHVVASCQCPRLSSRLHGCRGFIEAVRSFSLVMVSAEAGRYRLPCLRNFVTWAWKARPVTWIASRADRLDKAMSQHDLERSGSLELVYCSFRGVHLPCLLGLRRTLKSNSVSSGTARSASLAAF